jgi:hypothetical protein
MSKKSKLTQEAALVIVRKKPSVTVPIAGRALWDFSDNTSYAAAENGTLGVKVHEVGGGEKGKKQLRVSSADILQILGLSKEIAPATARSSRDRRQVAA